MRISEALGKRRLFFDGGTGTLLQGYGLKPGEPPERFNTENPAAVTETHRMYLDAGADIITTNTFGAYSHKYTDAARLIEAAFENAKRAAGEYRRASGGGPWIALDIGPTGRLLKPMGELGFEECYAIFREAAETGVKCGADLAVIETMSDLYELKAAVLAARDAGLIVFAAATFDERGRTLTGADAFCLAVLTEGLNADAAGMNCGCGPAAYEKLLPELLTRTPLPALIQPNAGLPVTENGAARYDLTPRDFAEHMARIAESGARILGGCCGTTPAHIRAMKTLCAERGLLDVPFAPKTIPAAVCSGVKAVPLTPAPVILRCAATEPDALADEASELADEADIVEVCLTGAEILPDIQSLTRAPLSLDACDARTLIASARLYNGRPLIRQNACGGSLTDEARRALARYGAVFMD